MGHTLITAPAGEPITLIEAKLQCRVDTADEDDLINALIVTAREQAEHRLGRALITQTWLMTLEWFSSNPIRQPGSRYEVESYLNTCREIKLPLSPLQSISFIKYLDSNGDLQTLANTEYQVITSELIAKVLPAYEKTWPSTRCQPESIQIQYIAGFGDTAADVPSSIKTWMKMAIESLYKNRGGLSDNQQYELPQSFFDALLDPHRVWQL